MNVHTMLSYGDTPMCITMVKEQGPSCPDTNSWEKIDIEAKGQGHTELVNVFYTPSMVMYTHVPNIL